MGLRRRSFRSFQISRNDQGRIKSEHEEMAMQSKNEFKGRKIVYKVSKRDQRLHTLILLNKVFCKDFTTGEIRETKIYYF